MNAKHLALALSIALAAAACDARSGSPAPGGGGDPDSGSPAPGGGGDPDPLTPLRRFEATRRAATDFARLPSSDRLLGPDPIALQPVAPAGRPTAPEAPAAPAAPALLSPLRGRDALVLLDASLRELSRAPAPASPTGVAVTASGDVYASGEASPVLFRYALRGAALEPAGRIELAGLHGVRDLAAGPEGVLYALDERAGALLTLRPGPAGADGRLPVERAELPIGAGPIRVVRLGRHLLVNCLLDHTLVVLPVGADGHPLPDGAARIRHDGPIWSFDALELGGPGGDRPGGDRPGGDGLGGGLLLAAGGVEDHPLDRTGGSFGYIDSFVFLYRVTAGARPEVTRLAAVNVSEHGVLTPKAIALSALPGSAGARVIATGYGGDRRAELVFRATEAGLSASPEVTTRPLAPGVAAMAPLGGGALAYANPLLDAWLLDAGGDGGAVAKRPVRDDGEDGRSAEVRLGEALFFTSLMAPWNRTDGPLSRFTCETCHFEGYVDGRTHHTGRGDVRATTKPLLGLFNNRPHFSRALDPDLTAVADNEFRVAGARSGHDPWFSLSPGDAPWLAELGVTGEGRAELRPEALRRALMSFLMAFSHRRNPAAQGRARFTALERAGARVFHDRCARCHAPVLKSDDPGSAVPFERWEALVLAPEGAIVWGRAGYEKTGVVPYVHEDGARVPSLRRLYKKRPYFTNGSAKTLREVLERARFDARPAPAGAAAAEGAFFHDGAPAGAGLAALDPGEIEALLAFLDLL
ncbi:hypothetical protein WMF31_13380 [Sorangium sp. So ce1036]|uniref:hypothetical protein n=1 Tax=Sorangium sp. So ce1036 TaxID=3133328 RepID=UPI003F04A7F7